MEKNVRLFAYINKNILSKEAKDFELLFQPYYSMAPELKKTSGFIRVSEWDIVVKAEIKKETT